MKVNCLVIEPFNGHQPGEQVDVTEREARQLEAKGLVKMGMGGSTNKSLPGPAENKANPLPAAGMVARVSAPPVAQALPLQTPPQSYSGKRRGRPPGRSSR